MTVILFDATRPVKPARPFALGLAATAETFEPSDADREWAAAEFERATSARVRRIFAGYGRRAGESHATDALCAGQVPWEVGSALMASSFIGHD